MRNIWRFVLLLACEVRSLTQFNDQTGPYPGLQILRVAGDVLNK